MAVTQFSRYLFTSMIQNEDGYLYLTEREPFRFQNLPDNIRHVVESGDWWPYLAHEFYKSLPVRSAGLWWIICDFQPQPVIDPTIRPEVGSLIVAPSQRVVVEEIFSERRRKESNVA
jgi:hypothetical protein